MKIYFLAISLLYLPTLLLAQSLERKVFSNGGGSGTIGPNVYQYTIGEAVVGTASNGALQLTKGFQQPIPNVSVLSFQLLHFEAQTSAEGVFLSWIADLPQQQGLFELEHSLDGVQFSPLAKVAPIPGEQEFHPYQHLDPRPLPSGQTIWYRMRMVSSNGQLVHSPLIAVRGTQLAQNWQVYPNPSQGQFQVTGYLAEGSPYQFRLYNALGQLVLQENGKAATAFFQKTFLLTHLSKGTYQLVFQSPTANWTRQLLLQ